MLSPQLEFVTAITASALFLVGVVFGYLGSIFDDKAFRYYSAAFLILATGRIFNDYLGFTEGAYLSLTVLARSIASYLLIVGSINGDARYKETKIWLGFSLALSFAVFLYTGNASPHTPLSIGPQAFAMAVGFVFTAGIFYWRWVSRKTCNEYIYLSILFALKAIITTASVWWTLPVFWGAADFAVLSLILAFGIKVALLRHTIREACEFKIGTSAK